jgi:hypothetical protein
MLPHGNHGQMTLFYMTSQGAERCNRKMTTSLIAGFSSTTSSRIGPVFAPHFAPYLPYSWDQ